jgi:YVTN family beta-propeller protein
MDETSLRLLLERALIPEPPIGPVAENSLRAGIKRRRRRQMRAAAGGAAAIAVIAVAIPVVTGALGHTTARRTGTTAQAETVYVIHNAGWFVTPISTITNTAGKRIRAAKGAMAVAVTPDGKTVYVANWRADTVTPITTATNRAGKPVRIGEGPGMIAIAITGDGKTVYVVSSTAGTVTPIATATNTPGKPIKIVGRGPFALVIAPDSHGAGHH